MGWHTARRACFRDSCGQVTQDRGWTGPLVPAQLLAAIGGQRICWRSSSCSFCARSEVRPWLRVRGLIRHRSSDCCRRASLFPGKSMAHSVKNANSRGCCRQIVSKATGLHFGRCERVIMVFLNRELVLCCMLVTSLTWLPKTKMGSALESRPVITPPR